MLEHPRLAPAPPAAVAMAVPMRVAMPVAVVMTVVMVVVARAPCRPKPWVDDMNRIEEPPM